MISKGRRDQCDTCNMYQSSGRELRAAFRLFLGQSSFFLPPIKFLKQFFQARLVLPGHILDLPRSKEWPNPRVFARRIPRRCPPKPSPRYHPTRQSALPKVGRPPHLCQNRSASNTFSISNICNICNDEARTSRSPRTTDCYHSRLLPGPHLRFQRHSRCSIRRRRSTRRGLPGPFASSTRGSLPGGERRFLCDQLLEQNDSVEKNTGSIHSGSGWPSSGITWPSETGFEASWSPTNQPHTPNHLSAWSENARCRKAPSARTSPHSLWPCRTPTKPTILTIPMPGQHLTSASTRATPTPSSMPTAIDRVLHLVEIPAVAPSFRLDVRVPRRYASTLRLLERTLLRLSPRLNGPTRPIDCCRPQRRLDRMARKSGNRPGGRSRRDARRGERAGAPVRKAVGRPTRLPTRERHRRRTVTTREI